MPVPENRPTLTDRVNELLERRGYNNGRIRNIQVLVIVYPNGTRMRRCLECYEVMNDSQHFHYCWLHGGTIVLPLPEEISWTELIQTLTHPDDTATTMIKLFTQASGWSFRCRGCGSRLATIEVFGGHNCGGLSYQTSYKRVGYRMRHIKEAVRQIYRNRGLLATE